MRFRCQFRCTLCPELTEPTDVVLRLVRDDGTASIGPIVCGRCADLIRSGRHPADGTKVCRLCGETKPHCEFRTRRGTVLLPRCKACRTSTRAIRYAANRDRERSYSCEYYRSNRDKVLDRVATYGASLHGVMTRSLAYNRRQLERSIQRCDEMWARVADGQMF